MKLAMTLLVRDEADIVRQNIDFHLECGVDYIVAIDNGSIDGTRDILAEYQQLGLATVVDEPGRDYSQGKWMTRAALMARDEFGADWILNNDADEFWVSPRGELKSHLVSSRSQVHSCQRRNMIYPYDEDTTSRWYDRLRFRVEVPTPVPSLSNIYEDELPCPYFYLALPPKVLASAAGLTSISQGNHSATYENDAHVETSEITIYHFPVRSPEQFERKITQGGDAYLANKDLPAGMGWHWRRWHRKIAEDGLTAALSEALPSASELKTDLAAHKIVEDRTIQEILTSG